MKRALKSNCTAAAVLLSIGMPLDSCLAKGNHPAQPQPQPQAPQANNAAALNAMNQANQANQARMQEMRQAQERAAQQQQAQARNMQAAEMKAQEESRRSQEQVLKSQEENARRSQMEAVKAQQDQMKHQQEQMAENQRNAQAQVAKQQQQAQEKAMQERNEQMQAQSKAAIKQQQQAQRDAEREAQRQAQAQAKSGRELATQPQRQPEEAERRVTASAMNHPFFPNTASGAPGSFPTARPMQARPLPTEHALPIAKAISMPVLEENIHPDDKVHAEAVQQNLQAHLIALPGNQAPANFAINRNAWLNNYRNNFAASINNQRILINSSNTYVNSCLPSDYPYWYHPEPGWNFSNGFVLGNSLRVGLDWLRWGWHPYYGPLPDGFVCASDFVPTPWIYFPAYGLWMQPGVYGWAPSGPPYDYTGPITVEVLEPRHLNVRDPYTGWEQKQVMNVIYMYNAFFDPEYEHWGYTNRHGYFVWLNI